MCKSTRNRRGLLITLQRDLTHAHCNIHCEYIYMRLLFEDGYYSKCGVYSRIYGACTVWMYPYTVNPVIYAVILFMRIMRVVVRAHK